MLLQSYREKPLPSFSSPEELLASKDGYRNYAMDLARALQQESFAEVREYGIAGDNYYRGDIPNPPYNQKMPGSIPNLLLRKSLIDKLVRINKKLATEGLELYIFDAWRPIALQYFARKQCEQDIKKAHMQWSDEQVSKEADKYRAASPANEEGLDLLSPPPHSTGGAVDLTIRNISTKEALDMGSAFDQMDDSSQNYYFETHADRKKYATVIENRRLKYRLFDEEGFITNPTERRHNSWGDQMWAKLSNVPAAHYTVMHVNG